MITLFRTSTHGTKVWDEYFWVGDNVLSKHFPLGVKLYWVEFMYERNVMTKEQYENLAATKIDLESKGYE